MSSTDPPSLNEFMDRFRRFIRRHCVSLAYVLKDKPHPNDWQFATGILLDLDGHKIVATVGHWVDKLQEAKDTAALHEVHIRYPHVSEEFEQKRIETDCVSSETMPTAEDFDGAIIRLPDALIDAIAHQDNHFFVRDQILRGKTEERHLVIVCGYPSQAIIVTSNPAFYTRAGGHIYQHNHIQIGSLAFQSTLLQPKGGGSAIFDTGFDCDVGEFAFQPFGGKINSRPESGISSARGMSGGPVIAITFDPDNDRAFFEPGLLGMQFYQKYVERCDGIEITELDSVSASRLVDWIDGLL